MIKGVTIDKESIYSESIGNYYFDSIEFRDNLYNKFSRSMLLLLDSKKPRTVFTDKGRLEPRRAYRYNFSNNIFKTHQSIPTGDTTIVFLIDGSGSMDSGGRIEKCSAICSAFAKAVNDVAKNQIKFEVFVKHAPCVEDNQYGGSFVTLTNILSNAKEKVTDYDKILRLNTNSPLSSPDPDDREIGSYTAEFAVLPALRRWMAKDLTTKNAIVVNLTDGEAYCSLGAEGRKVGFNNYTNGQMRTKYLYQVPHVTVVIGRNMNEKEKVYAYGKSVIECEDESFVPNLFKLFMGFLEQSYE